MPWVRRTPVSSYIFFFFNDTATTEIYTLSLHDALPICQDFVAALDDQLVLPVPEPVAGMVCLRGRLLENRVGHDHLARHEILADAEMIERALGLRTPQLVGRHLYDTEAVSLFSGSDHSGTVCTPRARAIVRPGDTAGWSSHLGVTDSRTCSR